MLERAQGEQRGGQDQQDDPANQRQGAPFLRPAPDVAVGLVRDNQVHAQEARGQGPDDAHGADDVQLLAIAGRALVGQPGEVGVGLARFIQDLGMEGLDLRMAVPEVEDLPRLNLAGDVRESSRRPRSQGAAATAGHPPDEDRFGLLAGSKHTHPWHMTSGLVLVQSGPFKRSIEPTRMPVDPENGAWAGDDVAGLE